MAGVFTGERTEASDRTESPPGPPSGTTKQWVRSWAVAALVAGCIAVVIMAFFLSIYRERRFTVPIGWDTSKYLWRTALVQEFGIADLQSGVPSSVNADPGRPAFPVIASTMSSLLRAHPFHVAAVLPAVSAAAIGLAAGAFIAMARRRSTWELAIAAFLVGTSAFVVRLSGPETYHDNLFAAAVFMAAAIPLALTIADRRAILPAILLFGAGGVVHWAFFAFMMAAILLAAACYLPAWVRRRRSGRGGLLDEPAARVGAVAGGAALVAAAAIFGLLSAGARSPRLSIRELFRKFDLDVGKYNFPITLPLAGVGAASLAVASREQGDQGRRSRFVLTFLAAWSGVALAGVVALHLLRLEVPAHRFLAFALAVPVLAVLGLLWTASMVERRARLLAGIFLAVAIVGAASVSHVVWFRTQSWMDPAKIEDAATAGAYLDAAGIDGDRPVVFIVGGGDGSYTALMGHMIRASLPTHRIDDAYLYVGSPDAYLARRPTPGATREAETLSRRYFRAMAHTYRSDPVALLLRSFDVTDFDAWVEGHPQSVAAPDVAVVKGPLASVPVPPARAPVGGLRSIRIGLLAIGAFGTFWLVGIGWSLALLGRWMNPPQFLSVAPAVGVAALVMAGVVADRIGVRLSGIGGMATPLIAGAAGWAAAMMAFRTRRASRDRPPGTPPPPNGISRPPPGSR